MAIRVALLGTKFMGKAHSQAYRNVNMYFPDAPQVEMRVIVGRNAAETETARRLFGWREASTDWRAVVARPDIDVVDVSTTGDTHCEMALAAAAAGKHIICEKPLANTLKDAQKMLAAVEKAKVRHLVMHNYRRVPAVALARKLLSEGKLGKIYHWRARYLQDWAMSPDLHLVWRFSAKSAGSGALGDLGAHIIDLARYLVGEITEVSATMETFLKERPVGPGSTKKARVTVDDAAIMLARFKNGALGTFEATRFARGRKNQNTFEINGEQGSISFDLEHLNVLKYYSTGDSAEVQGFHDILCVTKGVHPYADAWWFDGHILGYEHTFTHTVYDFLKALESRSKIHPDFVDGVRNQTVLDAAERASKEKRWVAVKQ
jgi:predicted dehydrogenase